MYFYEMVKESYWITLTQYNISWGHLLIVVIIFIGVLGILITKKGDQMDNDIIIKEDHIPHFRNMIVGIMTKGWTNLCPEWEKSLLVQIDGDDKCFTCRQYLPKVTKSIHDPISSCSSKKCPCYVYKKEYLIRFLKKVISNSR